MAPGMLLFLSVSPSKKVVVSLGCILFGNVFTAVFLDEKATEFFGRCSGRALLCGPGWVLSSQSCAGLKRSSPATLIDIPVSFHFG